MKAFLRLHLVALVLANVVIAQVFKPRPGPSRQEQQAKYKEFQKEARNASKSAAAERAKERDFERRAEAEDKLVHQKSQAAYDEDVLRQTEASRAAALRSTADRVKGNRDTHAGDAKRMREEAERVKEDDPRKANDLLEDAKASQKMADRLDAQMKRHLADAAKADAKAAQHDKNIDRLKEEFDKHNDASGRLRREAEAHETAAENFEEAARAARARAENLKWEIDHRRASVDEADDEGGVAVAAAVPTAIDDALQSEDALKSEDADPALDDAATSDASADPADLDGLAAVEARDGTLSSLDGPVAEVTAGDPALFEDAAVSSEVPADLAAPEPQPEIVEPQLDQTPSLPSEAAPDEGQPDTSLEAEPDASLEAEPDASLEAEPVAAIEQDTASEPSPDLADAFEG